MGDALKNVIDNISHAENDVDSSLRTVIITGAGLLLGFFTVGFCGGSKMCHHGLKIQLMIVMIFFFIYFEKSSNMAREKHRRPENLKMSRQKNS